MYQPHFVSNKVASLLNFKGLIFHVKSYIIMLQRITITMDNQTMKAQSLTTFQFKLNVTQK